jgi:hypothetical protein
MIMSVHQKETNMNIQNGNKVLVNLAPFIGSWQRCKDSIPCRVLSVKESSIEIATEPPYRELTMWISPSWIEGIADHDFCTQQDENRDPVFV